MKVQENRQAFMGEQEHIDDQDRGRYISVMQGIIKDGVLYEPVEDKEFVACKECVFLPNCGTDVCCGCAPFSGNDKNIHLQRVGRVKDIWVEHIMITDKENNINHKILEL